MMQQAAASIALSLALGVFSSRFDDVNLSWIGIVVLIIESFVEEDARQLVIMMNLHLQAFLLPLQFLLVDGKHHLQVLFQGTLHQGYL